MQKTRMATESAVSLRNRRQDPLLGSCSTGCFAERRTERIGARETMSDASHNDNGTESAPPIRSSDWAQMAGYLAAESVKLRSHPELTETADDLLRWSGMALDAACSPNGPDQR